MEIHLKVLSLNMSTCSQDLWREFLLPVDPVDRFSDAVGWLNEAGSEEVVEKRIGGVTDRQYW